jgi:hypothetical protein
MIIIQKLLLETAQPALFKLDYSELNYSFLIKVLQDSGTQE